jgi:hypothetical protein
MMMLFDKTARRTAGAIGLLALVSTAASAQGTVDNRWQAWTGCWQAVPAPNETTSAFYDDALSLSTLRLIPNASAASRAAPTATPLVCVVPASGQSAIQVITVDSGKVIARDTIDASGQQVSVSRDGCIGWRRAAWSADNRRVYLRSELDCTGGLHRSSSSVVAMAPTSEWLDVQGLRVSGNTAVRTRRYRNAGLPTTLPADVATAVTSAIGGRQLAISTARASAGGQVLPSDVIDASRQLDSSVVQAWLIERGQRFDVDAKALVKLADAGVPGSVTDAMIAVSYPKYFELQRAPVSGMYGEGPLTRGDSARIASEYLFNRCSLGYDPFWYSPCGYGYGYGGLYSYNRYGYRYGYGYSSYGFGGGYYGGYNYYVPVIVERGASEPHGQVVKGQGYTRGRSSSSGSSSSDGGGSRSSGSSGSSGGSSSSGSSSSGSSGSSSSGRTAHPRP